MKKFGCIGGIVLLLLLVGFVWFKFYFPFGDDSVKDGYLNKIERKGYIFKTWEGTIIQTGIKSVSPGAVQSNTFEFSVQNDAIARELQRNSGKYFVLHYKEYKGALPWRGHSKYIVDSIISIRDLGGEARPNY
ncbi:hypothetical protein [Polluticaenibacter yanchengensis]|uniref:6-phosphogluconate dehydrogenase n=1 Tax=Polluticaenibacter yanchengensis TaxID=3014562 RepID=A0ABT4UN38_9BACT|nr:hypothetical protein [Chitinophagaceae bacterium LY-5]